MEKFFVPYELSVKLKEKGFREKCLAFYAGNPHDKNYKWVLNICENKWHEHKNNTTAIIAPLYGQVTDWCRDKHNIFITIQLDQTSYMKYDYDVVKWINVGDFQSIPASPDWGLYRNYYDALNKAIEEALTLI